MQVYPYTTNPGVTTGDGMAMAARGKAAMANMEFVQFHPTSFYTGAAAGSGRSFLISEAVRGEGGLLYNQAGDRFMTRCALRFQATVLPWCETKASTKGPNLSVVLPLAASGCRTRISIKS